MDIELKNKVIELYKGYTFAQISAVVGRCHIEMEYGTYFKLACEELRSRKEYKQSLQ